MTVKDCIKTAAEALGISELVNGYLDAQDSEGEKVTKLLLQCYNLVENELALDYLPLMAEDEVETATGVVDFSVLKNDAVRIVKVQDAFGEAVKYKLFPKYLKTQPGRLAIVYAYTPKEKDVESECECALSASARLISYGMAAEYCLHMGLYEEAAVWDKKYKGAIEAAYKATPCKRIRSRRWA